MTTNIKKMYDHISYTQCSQAVLLKAGHWVKSTLRDLVINCEPSDRCTAKDSSNFTFFLTCFRKNLISLFTDTALWAGLVQQLQCPSDVSCLSPFHTIFPNMWTRIVDLTHSPDSFTKLVNPTCGALRTRSCSGLDLRIVDAWEVFNSWIIPTQSLENGEGLQIGPKYFVQFLTQC